MGHLPGIAYDPDDPEEAYLELTATTPKLEIAGGIVFCLAGVAIVWVFGSMSGLWGGSS